MRMINATGSGQYEMCDWLKVHDINTPQLQKVISFSNPTQNHATTDFKCGLSAMDAWELAAAALCQAFPDRADLIHKVKSGCTLEFTPDENGNAQPFTFDRGSKEYPHVSVKYTNRVSDLICIAHEFGHAVQYWASQVKFTPPVMRELAAFVSEMALLSYLQASNHKLSQDAQMVWDGENSLYLDEDAQVLSAALPDQKSPYNYRWNYPIARVLAIALYNPQSDSQLWGVFRGQQTVSDCISSLPAPRGIHLMDNYLPEVPKPDTEQPAINAYRSLGMMALLDIDYWKGHSELSIEDYYSKKLLHMQNSTALVAIGAEDKPIGYAAWEPVDGNPETVKFTRQSAPFGNHLELQKKLQKRLPDMAHAYSQHERSARKEQTAW